MYFSIGVMLFPQKKHSENYFILLQVWDVIFFFYFISASLQI